MPEIKTLPVLPLRDIVVFPHMIVPLEEVMRADRQIVLVTQREASHDDPKPDELYEVGTVANVLQLLKLPDGTVKVLVEGGSRASLVRFEANEEFFEATVEVIDGEGDVTSETKP